MRIGIGKLTNHNVNIRKSNFRSKHKARNLLVIESAIEYTHVAAYATTLSTTRYTLYNCMQKAGTQHTFASKEMLSFGACQVGRQPI